MLTTTPRRVSRLATKAGSSRRPTRRAQPSSDRHFSRHSQLLLVSRPITRPQLPYLYSNSHHASPFQHQVARLLSTETKKTIKETVIGVIRYTIYFQVAIALGSIAYMGWNHSEQEDKTPTPPEWSFWTRWHFREAKEKQSPHQLQGFALPHWSHVASNMRSAVERLENPEIDGAGIISALGEGEGEILVEGVGKTGLDISAKSEPWRRGYFQALMTAGLAAEHVEGFVTDSSRGDRVFSGEVVVGPSNQRPRPMPLTKDGIEDAPKEENCKPFFELPQVYYMKVLTTTGFNNDQRMQAALAYADWLGHKGLFSSARDMHNWAIDIASESYQQTSQTPPIDRKTGAIQLSDAPVTSNLLTAATSLAVHLAQSGDTTSALSTFLSILRAQRSLPTSSPKNYVEEQPLDPASYPTQWGPLSKIIVDAPYPAPPPSGDSPASKGPDFACNEAGILAHIGEILFVTPSNSLPKTLISGRRSKSNDAVEATAAQEAGLAWTRQAVDLAEEALEKLCGRNKVRHVAPGAPSRPKFKPQELGLSENEHKIMKEACAGCLEMAMSNWQQMVGKLASLEHEIKITRMKTKNEAGKHDTAANPIESSSWWAFWQRAGSADEAGGKAVGKWIEEGSNVITERRAEIRQMLREERLPIRRL